jgi:hypothetical protein
VQVALHVSPTALLAQVGHEPPLVSSAAEGSPEQKPGEAAAHKAEQQQKVADKQQNTWCSGPQGIDQEQ